MRTLSMNKKIILLNGSAAAGKDTFASMISSIIPSMSYSSVQYVKEAAKVLGWDGVTKDEKSRKFLSDLKILATEYNDHPYKMLCKVINDFLEDDIHEWLFLHVREPGEIRRLVKVFPEIITVLVENPNVSPVTSNMADAGVNHYYRYNEKILNDGSLADLQKKAENFVRKYRDEDSRRNDTVENSGRVEKDY